MTEEILPEVHLPLLVAGHIGQIEGRYAKHLAGTFTVAARDDRRMHP